MSLMEHYTIEEKRAVIAFLNMIIASDLNVKIEELNLVWMLAKSIHVDLKEIEKIDDETFYHTIANLSENQMVEVMRMGYTLMSVDQKHQDKEKKLLEFIRSLKQLDDQSYRHFYLSLNKMSDLTPLDQVVLLVLAHYMAEADGVVTQGEVQMLIVLCSMIGVDPSEVVFYKIPKDALYHAVFSMSDHAVKRIVEELLLISIADMKIAEQEYDFIFPIIAHFHFDFEDMLRSAKDRYQEHIDYYELFRAESEVN